MIAYPEQALYNSCVLTEAREEFNNSNISAESFQKIEQAYQSKLYTPNFFIAIALGLLTLVAVIFTTFLFYLLTNAGISSGLAVLCLLMAVLCYVSLEGIIKKKMFFNAGVDNALMILVLLFIMGLFLSYFENPSWLGINGTLMLVSLWLSIRFTDSFMAMVSGAFFFVLSYLLYERSGATSLIFFSLVMMLLIAGMYGVIKKIKKQVNCIYEKCVHVLTIFLLLAFYTSGNYWVINELQLAELSHPLPVSFGWIFWVFTFVIPFVYIFYGIIKRDVLHIRTGVFLVMMSVLSYKYYFNLFPVEFEMLFLGIILVTICYFLIKWLQKAKYGFIAEMIIPQPSWRNIEALVIAETMGGSEAPQKDSLFQGGSSGGAGASGEF